MSIKLSVVDLPTGVALPFLKTSYASTRALSVEAFQETLIPYPVLVGVACGLSCHNL
ncbi:MAG: hypothetical protein HYR80_01690 [Nitrospirae bacterium]|nr:hypothetical protein [Nitrospirota bacterium]